MPPAQATMAGLLDSEPLAAWVDLALCGAWHLPEFTVVRRWFDGMISSAPTPTLAQRIDQMVADGRAPELLLCAQSHPGMVEAREIERLGRVAPLARLALVVGPWCEGEGRTGSPPAGATRLFWHEAPAWSRAVSRALAHGTSPPWSYLGGVWGGDSGGPAALGGDLPGVSSKLVAISADHLATYDALAATVGSLGYHSCWQGPDGRGLRMASELRPSAGIWDGGDLAEQELTDLTQFCRQLAPANARVIALVDFPRAHHVEQISAAGAAVLLGKPYRIGALADALAQIAT